EMKVAFVTHEAEVIPLYIRQRIADAGIELKCHCCGKEPSELQRFAGDADVIWFWGDEVRLPPDMLDRLSHCKALFRSGSGVDALPCERARQLGILVCNTPDSIAEAVAEHTVTLLLSLARLIPQQDRCSRNGEWRKLQNALQWHITGRTLGLVGYGRIARRVEKMMSGFNLKTLFHDPMLPDSVPLDDLLRQADFVSLHCPLTAETRNLIGERELALMKPKALLVNASRGGIVNEEALYNALKNGVIGGAALDVMEQEPFDTQSPLFTLDNVVVTPHLAAFSADFTKNFWEYSAAKLEELAGLFAQ
ncbi:MAG: hypothetical protein IKS20_12890, partial [Victivallales bacterium]|nr:hypothetical protein [Victivallales bacterium]